MAQNSRQEQNNQPALAEPFLKIFADRAEAEWAFDLLREASRRLRISGPYDPRMAVTVSTRAGRPFLHLNFGNWLVLGFNGPGHTPTRVEIALLAHLVSWDERFVSFASDRKEGEPEVRSYQLPLEAIRPLTSHLQHAFETTLDFIADKFAAWKRSPHWKQHNPELVEAFFDPHRRALLFAGGLDEPELRYERHYTAFDYELAEEGVEYGVGESGDEKMGRLEIGERDIHKMKQRIIEEKLKDAFSRFREDIREQLIVRLRQQRAKQLRALLSKPEAIDLETFNHEIWISQSGTDNKRTINPYEVRPTSLEEIQQIEQAVESGELELHGNCIWGSATRVYSPRLKDDAKKLKYIRQALAILNNSELTPMQKVQQITEVYGFGNNIATGLVMVFHPDEFCLYNERGKQILQNLGYETGDSLDTYEATLHYLKEKLQAEDFIELDWFLYEVNEGKYPINIEGVTEFIDNAVETNNLLISPTPQPPGSSAPYPLSQLAADTGLDEESLARWVRAIGRKGQAILYGPPGTGKTFVAEKLAAHLAGGGDGFTELVQFHPAYAYEDFVQGIRPQSEGDRLSYPVVPGRFLEFCRQAQHRRDTCVLIIDEINRANLSRVFGELMYLLEYRDRAIPLAGGGQLKIPANVRLIGTMNTADRSIALVDHALRRRFAFIALRPNVEALRRYHQKTGFPVEGLINVLERLNQRIEDDYRLGITFFMDERLADHVEDIWRLEIEPYLEEYFFDRREEVNDFRWERVKAEILPA